MRQPFDYQYLFSIRKYSRHGNIWKTHLTSLPTWTVFLYLQIAQYLSGRELEKIYIYFKARPVCEALSSAMADKFLHPYRSHDLELLFPNATPPDYTPSPAGGTINNPNLRFTREIYCDSRTTLHIFNTLTEEAFIFIQIFDVSVTCYTGLYNIWQRKWYMP